jgi:hypothetical protein
MSNGPSETRVTAVTLLRAATSARLKKDITGNEITPRNRSIRRSRSFNMNFHENYRPEDYDQPIDQPVYQSNQQFHLSQDQLNFYEVSSPPISAKAKNFHFNESNNEDRNSSGI